MSKKSSSTAITPEEFKKQLNELGQIIAEGIADITAWRELMVDDEESAQALNRFRGLFISARKALLWMALMQFAKAFDKDMRTVSIRKLLDEAMANPAVLVPRASDKELNEIKERIEGVEDILEKLKSLRDQRIAHHDAIVADKQPLIHRDVKRLIEDTKWMYNELHRFHDGNVWSFDNLESTAEWHTSVVIRIMREERERDKKKIEEADTDS